MSALPYAGHTAAVSDCFKCKANAEAQAPVFTVSPKPEFTVFTTMSLGVDAEIARQADGQELVPLLMKYAGDRDFSPSGFVTEGVLDELKSLGVVV